MITPITPNEVIKQTQKYKPEYVYKAFNALLLKHWEGQSATFSQDEAECMIMEYAKCTRQEVLDNAFLDIEAHYEEYGWSVHYNANDCSTDHDATFTFYKRK